MRILAILSAVLAIGLCVAATPAENGKLSDDELARALLEGEVVSIEEIGTGVTKPRRVTLEWQGHTVRAAFKALNMHRTKRTRFLTGPERVTLSFTDNFHYERAAYLLDRRLGLGMVPVSVLRTIDREEGALVAWVEDAISEGQRLEQELRPEDPVMLAKQRARMRLFDALIANVDRNQGNRLYTRPDWKLHLIDHTRAFRLTKDLPPDFEHDPASVPRALFERLRSLTRDGLEELFDGTVSREQIRYLIKRRDRIVAKVEADIESYGEGIVFCD